MVGARDSVPSLGPMISPEPGRGGGVTSIGFGGFGDGAADEAAVLVVALGVAFLATGAGAGAGAGTGEGVLPRVKCAGTGALGQDSCCLSAFTPPVGWFGTIVFIIIGDGVGLFAVGDAGTEL